MEELRKYVIQPIANVFRYHKFKVFFVFICSLVFFVVLFPFKDVGGIISAQINKATRNQVQVSFENLGVSLVPFGISASEVYVLTPKLQNPLYIKKAYISPSILSFLSFKPGGSLTAQGLFGGDLQAKFSNLGQDGANNENSKMFRVQLDFKDIDLEKMATWLKLPVNTGGLLAGTADVRMDANAFAQPKGGFVIQGKGVKLPGVISMQGMDLMLPEGQLKKLVINGKMQNGNLKISESQIGQPNDVIYGKLKGNMGLRARSTGAGLSLVPGQYTFSMDLNFSKEAESKLGTMIGTVLLNGKGGRSKTLDGGARYVFSVSGFPRAMPKFQPLNQF